MHELITVEGLRDRAAALYHDPRIQNLAGDKLAWYLDHPAVAMEELSRLERLGQVPSQLAHDVRLVFEESREMGVLTEGPIAPSAPPVGAAAEAERARLLDKSVTGRLSASEEARLTQLYEAKIASDDRAGAGQAEEELAAHRRALGGAAEPRGARKPRGGEYERLIAASVSGGATAADEARLVELAGERAVAEGQITNDQLERDNG